MPEPVDLLRLVPPLRRFSRLLIGDAARADELVEAALLRVLALDIASACAPGLRLMLFKSLIDRFMLDATARELDRPEPVGAGDRCSGASALLAQAVRSLPAQPRIALLLLCVERLSIQETAELLASDVEPVQACVWTARQDLAHRMAAMGRQGIEGGRAVAHL